MTKIYLILSFFALFSFLVLGIAYQIFKSREDTIRFPPPGKLVKVEGNLMHIHYNGSQGPTVVLDAGMGGTSLGWTLVQNRLALFTGVCSFDRAGYAWSEASKKERTSENLTKELHALLKEAQIPPPYLLVGHSFGGANALLFAHAYPKEVLGVILVDAVHEDYFEKLPFQKSNNFFNRLLETPQAKILLTATGIQRYLGPSNLIKEMFLPLPEVARNAYLAQMNKISYHQTVAREFADFEKSLAQLRKAHVQLENTPLTVITAGKSLSPPAFNQAWLSMQQDHLLKSSYSRHLFAEKSDHMIPHHQPQIIVEAVKDMLAIHDPLPSIRNNRELNSVSRTSSL